MLSELLRRADAREDEVPVAVLDAAIEGWLVAWNRIGGLNPEQRNRYRSAMRAAFVSARAAAGKLGMRD